MIEPNDDLCSSIKSKKENQIQCPLKRKNNTQYCGKHKNSEFNYNEIYDILNKDKEIKEDESKKIYSKEELMLNIENKKTMSVYSIRQSINHCFLKNFIQTRQSKKNIINDLHIFLKRERYYINQESYIIRIQSIIRMFLKNRKYICNNEIDILTMENKMDIEDPYFFKFYNKHNNKNYAYDIRLLHALIHSDYANCPYTLKPFDEDEKNKIKNHVKKLEKKGIMIQENEEMTEEEKIENKAKELFHQINMLDNYTSHKWFMNLDLIHLIKLYISAEDIWNYRSQLSIEAKQNIIGNNIIFGTPINVIRREKSKKNLQHYLLDIFNIMISNGNDINEKKLGAILILSALVEVSSEACYALPHLIQL
jgi:hypothetical protein